MYDGMDVLLTALSSFSAGLLVAACVAKYLVDELLTEIHGYDPTDPFPSPKRKDA